MFLEILKEKIEEKIPNQRNFKLIHKSDMLNVSNNKIQTRDVKFKDPNPPSANIPDKTISGLPFETGLIDKNPNISNTVMEIDQSKVKINQKELNKKKLETNTSQSINIVPENISSWNPNGFNPTQI